MNKLEALNIVLELFKEQKEQSKTILTILGRGSGKTSMQTLFVDRIEFIDVKIRLIENEIFQYKEIHGDSERVYAREIDIELGDVFTVKEWEEEMKEDNLCTTDGSGYWAKDGYYSDDEVFSTEPLDADSVVWFNK